MPSFTFFSSKDRHQIDALRSSMQCIAPDGFEGQRGAVDTPKSHLKWHCGDHAPIELHQTNEAGFAFLIGEAIAEESDDYLSALELFTLVSEHKGDAAAKLSRYSGFYAWIVVLDGESVYCGSDPFGFFPIYYFVGAHSLGIATSLNALHAHPEYDTSVDPVGFCRHLLENGCSSHRTLEKSGKRLDIAQSICYNSKLGELLTQQHPYPGQDAKKTVHDLDKAIQLSAKALNKAVARHAQRSIDSCLLSGGLDSRLVLGIAHELGHRPKCVTIGERESYESINARRVSRILKLPWEYSDEHIEAPQELLYKDIHLCALGAGFNSTPMSWRKINTVCGSRYLTGLYLDVTYGPLDPVDKDPAFGSFEFAQNTWIHNYGAMPDQLAELFNNPDFEAGLQVAREEACEEWNALNSDPIERHWSTISRYRGRAHHGGITWKNAFYQWPVIPALDVPLNEAIRSIDGQLIIGRKLQEETFIAMLPELAKIPFASVSSKPRPLTQTIFSSYYRRMEKLQRRTLRFKKKFSKNKVHEKETVKHSWHVAKVQAIEQLESASDIFDIDKVRGLLSDTTDVKKLSFQEQYSRRLISAGILWLANRKAATNSSNS